MTRFGRTVAGLAGTTALLALGAMAGAQGPGPGFGPGRGPGGPGGPGGRGAGVPPVPGAPFSATEVSTSNETLADGNAITRSRCANLYRDGAGDTREEVTLNSSTCSPTPQLVVITNVAAGMRYEINTQKNTYFEMKLRTPPNGAGGPPPAGEYGGRGGRDGNEAQKTPLGNQPINGTNFSAEGTQTTFTIPAGRFGNANPINITSTRWYSPDLHIVVQSSSNDPRGGSNSSQVSNISTAEPAASLFQLPPGLTLEKGHPGGRGQHGPPPPGL